MNSDRIKNKTLIVSPLRVYECSVSHTRRSRLPVRFAVVLNFACNLIVQISNKVGLTYKRERERSREGNTKTIQTRAQFKFTFALNIIKSRLTSR